MTDTRRQIFVFDLLILLILAGISAPFGFASLVDLDIGWHLASGLSILQYGHVPSRDFLGALDTPWVAYSWLFELIMAWVYRFSGFQGLQNAQFLLIFFSLASLYLVLVKDHLAANAHVLASLVVIFSVPLLAPFWHLRPQLLSVLLFTIVLSRVRARRGPSIDLIPLTILWANAHVFWIFSPILALLFSSTLRKACFSIMLCMCGLVGPYVTANYSVLWQYALKHSTGYSLIDEFLPLGIGAGMFFWCWLLFTLICIPIALRQTKSTDWRLPLLAIGFSLISFMQRKYLPFFAVTAAFLMFEAFSACLQVEIENSKRWWLALALSLVLGVMYFLNLPSASPLSAEMSELLHLSSDLQQLNSGSKSVVLNEFDDGGWLGLGLYLSRGDSTESPIRVSVDGRTLVWGPSRLDEFRRLLEGDEELCSIVAKWNPTYAVLGSNSRVLAHLKGCVPTWSVVKQGRSWTLLKSAPNSS